MFPRVEFTSVWMPNCTSGVEACSLQAMCPICLFSRLCNALTRKLQPEGLHYWKKREIEYDLKVKKNILRVGICSTFSRVFIIFRKLPVNCLKVKSNKIKRIVNRKIARWVDNNSKLFLGLTEEKRERENYIDIEIKTDRWGKKGEGRGLGWVGSDTRLPLLLALTQQLYAICFSVYTDSAPGHKTVSLLPRGAPFPVIINYYSLLSSEPCSSVDQLIPIKDDAW